MLTHIPSAIRSLLVVCAVLFMSGVGAAEEGAEKNGPSARPSGVSSDSPERPRVEAVGERANESERRTRPRRELTLRQKRLFVLGFVEAEND